MATKVKVAATADLPPGRACVVEAAGKAIALVNAAGQLYAVDNACMHRGGPVGDGSLDGRLLGRRAVRNERHREAREQHRHEQQRAGIP